MEHLEAFNLVCTGKPKWNAHFCSTNWKDWKREESDTKRERKKERKIEKLKSDFIIFLDEPDKDAWERQLLVECSGLVWEWLLYSPPIYQYITTAGPDSGEALNHTSRLSTIKLLPQKTHQKPGSKVRSRDPGVVIVLWLYLSVLLSTSFEIYVLNWTGLGLYSEAVHVSRYARPSVRYWLLYLVVLKYNWACVRAKINAKIYYEKRYFMFIVLYLK